MANTVVWVIAYVITGISFTTYMMGFEDWNQPRALRSTGGIIWMTLGWPLITLTHSRARAIAHVMLFLIYRVLGELIWSLFS